MKIAVVTAYYPPDVTGSALFAMHLVGALQQRNHQLMVCSCQDDPKKTSSETVFFHVPNRKRNLKSLSHSYLIPFVSLRFGARSLFRKLSEFKPEVIHIHGQIFDLSLYAMLYACIYGIPFVVTIHSPFWHTNKFFDVILRILDLLFIRPLLNQSTAIVNVDLQTRKYLNQRHPSVSPIEIPVSFPIDRVSKGRREVVFQKYSTLGIMENRRTILSLGHVIPMRNRMSLVIAFSQLLEVHSDLQLVIVGSVYDKSVLKLVEELGLSEVVLFTGAVAEEDVKHFLALADVECHDLQGIGIGLTTMEAMRAQVPAVFWLSENNWSKANFADYHLARLEDNSVTSIKEEIHRLLIDNEYRQSVILSQNEFMDSYLDFDVIVGQYLDVYQRAIVSRVSEI